MMTRLLTALAAAFLLLAAPLPAPAQETPQVGSPQDAVDDAMTRMSPDSPVRDPDWVALASRTESALAAGRVSNQVLADLRIQIAAWRDRFFAELSNNAGRIATVEAQIAALGAPPESGDEDVRIADRRTALQDQLDQLRAPVVLAEEARARAEGLIQEIDAIIRDRQTAELTERVGSPLNPSLWLKATEELGAALRATRTEFTATLSNPVTWTRLTSNLPQILGLTALGLILLTRGSRWSGRLQQAFDARNRRGRDVIDALLSLGHVLLPLVGLLMLSFALTATGLFGRRTELLIQTLAVFGAFPVIGRWMAAQLLPDADDHRRAGSLPAAERARLRRLFVNLGWSLAVQTALIIWLNLNGIAVESRVVVLLPLSLVLALVLFRLGRTLRHTPAVDESDTTEDAPAPRPYRETISALVGQVLMLVAVGATIAYLLGFPAAYGSALLPTVLTLYLLGALMLVVDFVQNVISIFTASDEAETEGGLIQALAGAALVVAALPVLALIWGWRSTDLANLWLRFREGFTLGDTRISPSDFLTLVVVFVIGYTVVRLIQGALRSSILPKTKLDAGGQNAIIAGVGYVGFVLAAVIAITTAGIDLSGLAIVAGALSVGIGFGLQTVVQNFVSGIILLIERPISKGDWIEMGGVMGYVRDISVRSTRIETFDRTDVIIPNADLISQQVTNWTRGNTVGRLIVPVGVAYGTDTRRVETILSEIARAHPMVLLRPPPAVVFQGFGADSLDFEIRAILRDVNWMLSVKTELNHAIAERFAAEGIEIPFAQRDIWLRNPEALRPGSAQAAVPDAPPTAPDDSGAPDAPDPEEAPE
ncbi:MAG: Small-conductance mechanosensitive channel [Rhodobacteraceae bacterium HLUCCA08]|nr:MAG: Small-conductance mechanosensitive channel [Rhodobacteraceae bacterium HLUCCA08]